MDKEKIRKAATEVMGIVDKFGTQELGNRLSEFSVASLKNSVGAQLMIIFNELKEDEKNGADKVDRSKKSHKRQN